MANTIELVVKENEEKVLYQWDTDRKIMITTDLVIDEVDFSNVLSNSAMVVIPSVDVELGGMVAQIPNSLLQNSMPVQVDTGNCGGNCKWLSFMFYRLKWGVSS